MTGVKISSKWKIYLRTVFPKIFENSKEKTLVVGSANLTCNNSLILAPIQTLPKKLIKTHRIVINLQSVMHEISKSV